MTYTKTKASQLRVTFVTSMHPDFDARVWRYCTMMAGRCHDVHLVCPWSVADGEKRDGVTLHPFTGGAHRLWRTIERPARIVGVLRRKGLLSSSDVIHFHDIDLLPTMAALSAFANIVYDIHENYPEEMLVRGWVPKLLRRPLYHGVRIGQAALAMAVRNVVLVVPEQGRDLPLKVLHHTIMRNFASGALAQSAAADYLERPKGLVFIGSNYEANGTFLVLDIAERLLQLRPDLPILFPDRWADANTKQRALARMEKLPNVKLVPNVSPAQIMQRLNQGTIALSADLRVPQRIRALPTKLFEYMAAGLPIVASDLPNTVSVLRDAQCSILCRPEEPESFVQAILRLDDDRHAAYELGQRGRRAFVDRFSWESQADNLEQFYATVLGERAPATQCVQSEQC